MTGESSSAPDTRILTVWRQLDAIADPEARRKATLAAADKCLHSEPPVAQELLARLHEEAEAAGDFAMMARAKDRLAEFLRRDGRLDQAEKLAHQALAAARRSGLQSVEAAAWNTTGLIHHDRAEYVRAQTCYERCMELSRGADYIDGELAALNQLGILMGFQGRIADALACYERCLVIDIERKDVRGEAVSRTNIGWMLERLGRWEDAAEQFYRAIAICEQEGNKYDRAIASCNLGELFVRRRRLDQAMVLFNSVIGPERKRKQPRAIMGIALMGAGQAMAVKGDSSAAMACFTEAAGIFTAVQDGYNLAVLGCQTAELALVLGRLADAEKQLGQAAELASELNLKWEKGEVLRVRGLLFAENGDPEATRDCFERALGEFADTPDSYETARVCLQYGNYLVGQGDLVRARALLKQAAATFGRLSVVAESEQAGRLLFELDVPERGANAILAGLQGLERIGIEPLRFIEEALCLLRTGLGLGAAALRFDRELLASAGEMPSAPGPGSEAVRTFKVELGDERYARLELYQGHGPVAAEPDAALLAAVARLLSGPARRLVETRPAPAGRVVPAGVVYAGVIGCNEQVVRNLEVIGRVADTGVPVLIRGESGTGKELVARAVHDSSNRRGKPFCAINCAAVPEGLLEAEFFGVARGAATGVAARKGKFELSAGGTVFLDEIGDMSPGLQAKLLRILQEREFEPVGGSQTIKADVRIIAATNQDVDRLIRSGRFRADLYYRLNAVEVVLPPLRERREDIPELVRHFIRRSNDEFGRDVGGISTEALEFLLIHDWPGNIRELQHVVERAVILCRGDSLLPEDLPVGVRPADRAEPAVSGPARQVRKKADQRANADEEKALVLGSLEQADWKVEAAAHRAGLSRAQFYRLMKRYGIKRPG